jgi:hypothetical protein
MQDNKNMTIKERFESLLCDPEGNISIKASNKDKILLRECIDDVKNSDVMDFNITGSNIRSVRYYNQKKSFMWSC